MAEEMNNAPQENGMEQAYLDTIQEMKKNTVSREVYDKQLEENRRLLNAIVNGEQTATAQEETKQVRAPKDVFNDLIMSDTPCTNIQKARYWIEYRESCKAAGEPDPYVSNGTKIKPTAQEIASVDRVEAALKHCIEYSGGNDEIFTNELNRLLIDTTPYYG